MPNPLPYSKVTIIRKSCAKPQIPMVIIKNTETTTLTLQISYCIPIFPVYFCKTQNIFTTRHLINPLYNIMSIKEKLQSQAYSTCTLPPIYPTKCYAWQFNYNATETTSFGTLVNTPWEI